MCACIYTHLYIRMGYRSTLQTTTRKRPGMYVCYIFVCIVCMHTYIHTYTYAYMLIYISGKAAQQSRSQNVPLRRSFEENIHTYAYVHTYISRTQPSQSQNVPLRRAFEENIHTYMHAYIYTYISSKASQPPRSQNVALRRAFEDDSGSNRSRDSNTST